MRRLVLALLLGLASVVGCARRQAQYQGQYAPLPGVSEEPAPHLSQVTKPSVPEPAPKVILTPETTLTGTVARVNTEDRFVVLNFPVGHMPAMGQRLNLYRRGLHVGEVKITGPQLDDDIDADVVTGDAETGDEVRDK